MGLPAAHDSRGSSIGTIHLAFTLLPCCFSSSSALTTIHPLSHHFALPFDPEVSLKNVGWLRCERNDGDKHCGISIDILALVCESNCRRSREPTAVLDI